jgi:hypothetical protein
MDTDWRGGISGRISLRSASRLFSGITFFSKSNGNNSGLKVLWFAI